MPDSLPPMAAGLFGYLGYDMVRLMEELPHPTRIRLEFPMPFCPADLIVVFDAVKDSITVVTPVRPEGRRCKSSADSRERAPCRRGRKPRPAARQVPSRTRSRPARHCRAIQHHAGRIRAHGAKAKDYILAGDIFQVVLSQRFEAPFTLAAVFALPRAATGQSVAVSLFSRLRRLRHRRIEPRNSGAGSATAR